MTEAVNPRRIIDVSSPGESAPHASSRPVIMSHKPVQDPMVSTPPAEATHEEIPPQPATPPEAPSPQASTEAAAVPQAPTQSLDVKQLVHDKTYFMPVSQLPGSHALAWLFALLVIIGGAGLYLFLAL